MRGAIVVGALLCASCSKKDDAASATPGPTPAPGVTLATLVVTSTAFAAGASIPVQYTCEGANTSPPLAWNDPPPSAKSFALVVDDPDAPGQTFVHWVLYDLDASTRSLPEGQKTAPAGAHDGKNDFGNPSWGGPCPPSGRHRYFHKVYALDTVLPDLGQPTKADLTNAMNAHVVAQGELVGTYQKTK
jgi:Raf kinase inhibitor-like YbhB/YbcL family protein